MRSFLEANNPTTRSGRLQLKRTFLSSGPAASRYARSLSSGGSSNYSGWRTGSLVSCYTVGLCLLINSVFAVYASITDPAKGGIGNLYQGSCTKVRNLDRWLHLLINMLGTALLSASSFNMQCLVSPTRMEVNAAHSKGIWLDIGVPSIKNLRYINWKRIALWWILAISSVPLHLLWNSVTFVTLQQNDYAVLLVSPDFLEGNGPNCTNISNLRSETELAGYHPDVVCNMYKAAKASNLTRLENRECIQQYGLNMLSQWSNLFVVSSGTLASNTSQYWYLDAGLPPNFNLNWSSLYDYLEATYIDSGPHFNDLRWMCSASFPETCTVAKALTNYTHWTLSDDESFGNSSQGLPIDHCQAARATEMCKLQYSLIILLAVMASNILKLFSILLTLKTIKEQHFITPGDAVSSFLTDPDMVVKGACLAVKSVLEVIFVKPKSRSTDTHLYVSGEGTVWRTSRNQSSRWKDAASPTCWFICIFL